MPLDDTTKHYEQALAPQADPFDYRTFTPGHNGLRKLAWVLRHPEVWQRTHHWTFTVLQKPDDCGTAGCALGVAGSVWPEFQKRIRHDYGYAWMPGKTVAAAFGIPMKMAAEIFCMDASDEVSQRVYGKPMHRVAPADVASAIDSYLARAEALAKSEAGGTP